MGKFFFIRSLKITQTSIFLFWAGCAFGQEVELVMQDGHRKEVTAFAVSTNEQLLATGGADGYVFIWDIRKRLKIFEKKFDNRIGNLKFENYSQNLIISSNGKTYIWDFFNTQELDTLPYSNIAFDNQMRCFGYFYSNSKSFGISLNSKKAIKPIAYSTLDKPSSNAELNIIKLIPNEDFTKILTIRQKEVNIWNISALDLSGKEQYQSPILENSVEIKNVNIDPVFTNAWYSNGMINIITFENNGKSNMIYSISFHEGSNNYSIEAIEIPIKPNNWGTTYLINSLDVDQTRSNIYASFYDDEMKSYRILIWNIESKKIISDILNQQGIIKALPSKNILFIGNTSVALWDLQRNQKIAELKDFGEEIIPLSIAFSPSQNIIASSNLSGLYLWDIENFSASRQIPIKLFYGSKFCFSSNGEMITLQTMTTKLEIFDVFRSKFYENGVHTMHNIYSFSFSRNDMSLNIIGEEYGGEILKFIEWKLGESSWSNNNGVLVSSSEVRNYAFKTIPQIGNILDSNNSITFSGDGNYAAVIFSDIAKPSKIEIVDLGNKINSKVLKVSPKGFFDQIIFDYNASKGLIFNKVSSGFDSLIVLNPKTNSFKKTPYKAIAPGFINEDIFYSAIYNDSRLLCLNTNTLKSTIKDINPGFNFAVSKCSRFLGSLDSKGTIDLYDLVNNKKLVSIYNFGSDGFIYLTPDNYYFATKGAISNLAVRIKNEVFPLDIFDLKYNRPDIVLDRIGLTDKTIIDAYKNAYQKRLQKMGFIEEKLSSDFHVPRTSIINYSDLPLVEESEINLSLNFSDTTFTLDRYNVWVNEVPLFGMLGKRLDYLRANAHSVTEKIKLSEGKNRIQVSCLNEKGAESYKETVEITYQPKVSDPQKFHFIGIGVDEYSNASYNLNYSVKDIKDLTQKLKEKHAGSITIDTLFNQNVTAANIMGLKEKLLKSDVNDNVIISFSGHGLLSSSYDYYLAMHNTNFGKPEEGGLPYEDLEWLLDSIPARKKLLLIDACHSGEVDKEELIAMNSTTNPDGVKGAQMAYEYEPTLGMKNSFELMQELFTNVNRGTGATIISAAAGTQFAYERGDLANGVFTYSILELMNQRDRISVSELKTLVGKRVEELTNGLQKPTSRNETVENDWWVW
jgi:WD40 repeat protein